VSFGFLDRMLEDAARHDRMARKWYAERGRSCPGDPGAPIVKLAAEIASGKSARDLPTIVALVEASHVFADNLRNVRSETPSGSATERAERSSESTRDSEP
jgi:hypothetical protein